MDRAAELNWLWSPTGCGREQNGEAFRVGGQVCHIIGIMKGIMDRIGPS